MANFLEDYYKGLGNGTTNNAITVPERFGNSYKAKKAKLAERNAAKIKKLGKSGDLTTPYDDGDSSQYIRIAGIDTPETPHEFDLHNERTKALKQFSYLNKDMSPQAAYYMGEGQYDATMIAKEQGQDLPQMITDYRKAGLIDADYNPQMFDIYQAGNEASRFAERDNIANPETGRDASHNFLTGKTGHFKRFLADNKEYAKRVIAEGYAAPGSTDKATYKQQLADVEHARKNKLGNYASEAGAKVMDAIIETSYAKRAYEGTNGTKSIGDMLHYESPEEFQKQVGNALMYQVYREDDGTYYEFAINPDGTFKNDINGKFIKEKVDAADIEAVYIGQGKQPINGAEIKKLGIARADMKKEFLEKYKDMGPEFIARYLDKTSETPYIGGGGDYDGTPGPFGVDLKKGAEMNILMRKSAAEHLEKYIHTHAGQVESRAAGSDVLLRKAEHDKYKEMFGAGTSEYTIASGKQAGPLWNTDYNMDEVANITDELKAEPNPTKKWEWDQVNAIREANPDRNIVASDIKYTPKNYGNKPWTGGLISSDVGGSSFTNAAKAFGYMAGEGIINTVDLVAETGEYAFQNMFGDGQSWSDTDGFYDKEDSETFKNWMGYNDNVVNALGQEATTAVKNAYENGDYWGLAKTVWEGATTPELVASSLGYVVGMALPGGIAKTGVQLVSGVSKAAKAAMAADTTGKLTKAQALLNAEEGASVGYKMTKIMAGNSGFVAEAEQFGREAEDLYKETYKEEMPALQKLAVRPLGLLYAKLDAVTAKAILLGKDPIAKAIPGMMKNLPDAMKKTFIGKVAALSGASVAKVTGAFTLEAGTEIVQTGAEKVAGKYKSGEVSVGDVLAQEKYEIGGAGLLGGAGGTQMSVGGSAIPAVASLGKLAIDNLPKDEVITATEATATGYDKALHQIKAVQEIDSNEHFGAVLDGTHSDLDAESMLNGRSGETGINAIIPELETHLAELNKIDNLDEASKAHKKSVVDALIVATRMKSVLEGNSKPLGNRAVPVIQADIDALMTEVDSAKRAHELVKLEAEKMVSTYKQDDTLGPVHITGKATEADSFALKMYGGSQDGVKLPGILDYVDIMNDPDTSAELLAGVEENLYFFMKSQSEKLDAYNKGQKEFELKRDELIANGASAEDIRTASVKVDYGDAGTYHSNTYVKFHKKLIEEDAIFTALNDKFLGGRGITEEVVEEATNANPKVDLNAAPIPVFTPQEAETMTDEESKLLYDVQSANDKDSDYVVTPEDMAKLNDMRTKLDANPIKEEVIENEPVTEEETIVEEENSTPTEEETDAAEVIEPDEEVVLTPEEQEVLDLEATVKQLEAEVGKLRGELKEYGVEGSIDNEVRRRNIQKQADKSITNIDREIAEVDKLLAKIESKLITPQVPTELKIRSKAIDAKPKVNTKKDYLKKQKANLENKKDRMAGEQEAIQDVAAEEINNVGTESDTKKVTKKAKELLATKEAVKIGKEKVKVAKKQASLVGTIGSRVIKSSIENPAKNNAQRKKLINPTNVLSSENKASMAVTLGTYFTAVKPKGNIELVGMAPAQLLEVLPDDRVEVLNHGIENLEYAGKIELVNKLVARLLPRANKVFLKDAEQVTYKYDIMSKDGTNAVEGFQSVSRLLKYMDADGKWQVDEAVIKAVVIASLNWLTVDAAGTRKEARSDTDLKIMLNMDKKDVVSREQREMANQFDGLLNNAQRSLGSTIYPMLGLKAGEHTVDAPTERIQDKMKVELGILGMQILEDANLIKLNSGKPTSDSVFEPGKSVTAKLLNPKASKNDTAIPTYTITSETVSEELYPTLVDEGELDLGIRPLTGNRLIGDGYVGTATDVALYVVGEDSKKTGPYFVKGENKTKFEGMKNQGVTKLVGDAPKENKLAIDKQDDTAWTMHLGYVTRFTEMYENSKDELLELFGWVDPETVHFKDASSVRGRNNEIERDVKHLLDTADMAIDGDLKSREMWFKWYIVTNGRFGIKSNTFNIQDNKMHRNAVDSGVVEVTKDSLEDTVALMAIGQGFDIDVDKQTAGTSVKELDKLMKKLVKETGVSLDAMYSGGEFMTGYSWIMNNQGGKEPAHALRALTEYLDRNEALKNGKTYSTGIRLETDAITSGYILKMMQMPIFKTAEGELYMEKVFEQLRKGGMFTKEDWADIKSFENMKENGDKSGKVLDAYEYPAEIMSNKINADPVKADGSPKLKGPALEAHKKAVPVVVKLINAKAIKEGVVTIVRNMMKNPFMVFNYGSGLSSIIAGQQKGAVEEIYAHLTKAGNVDSSKADRRAALKVVTDIITASATRTAYKGTTDRMGKPMFDERKAAAAEKVAELDAILEVDLNANDENHIPGILRANITRQMEEGVSELVKSVIADPLKQTFTEAYGEYMKAATTMNSSFSMMFRLAKPKLDVALSERTKSWNKENGWKKGSLTPLPVKEVEKVVYEMRKELPILELALADMEGEKSYALLSKSGKTEYASDLDLSLNNNSVLRRGTYGNVTSNYGQSELYGLIESYSSGAVIPIHFLDGMAQAKVLSVFKALGVHDANLFNVAQAVPGTKAYNKAVWELMSKYSLTTAVMESVHDTLEVATNESLTELDKMYFDEFVSNQLNRASEYRESVRDYLGKIRDAYLTEGRNARFNMLVDVVPENIEDSVMSVIEAMDSEYGPSSVKEVYANLSELQSDSEKGREVVLNKIKVVEHSALEGAEYTVPDKETYVAKVPNNKLGAAATEYMAKEHEVKSEEAIISDIKSRIAKLGKPAIATHLTTMLEGDC